MLNRIFCAVFGHKKWRGMGWLGAVSFGDFVYKQQCRCGITVYSVEPKWHLRARCNREIDPLDVLLVNPGKWDLESSQYEKQLDVVNEKYSIGVLADIHSTTINELQAIGYE